MVLGLGRGLLIGRDALINFKFDPQYPYAACKLCGEVFQTEVNRLGSEDGLVDWRLTHNRKHGDKEHIALLKSGRLFTPEAAQKLATFGIIDFGGLLIDPELTHAYATAPRAPSDDCEGSR